MPLLLWLTLFWHLGALIALIREPTAWPWIFLAVWINHCVIVACGMLPRSSCLGPNLQALGPRARERGEIALTFDDGPDPQVTPQLLNLLDAAGAKASFFVIGARAAQHPQLIREIAARGHTIGNHTWSHSYLFFFFFPRRLKAEIARVQQLVGELTGVAPKYFRAPAGIRSPLLQPVLGRVGLTLTSWSRRGYDAVDRRADRVLERLEPGLTPGGILLLHDGDNEALLESMPRLLERIREAGLRCVNLDEAVR
jgi:peptidoglycan/xylan/chitin deacetylase (PgdA/CDA1 family)